MHRKALRTAVALAVGFAVPSTATAGGWPAEGRDSRNTCQSDVLGPRDASDVSTYPVTEGVSINIPATVADAGTVYFGTWGVLRNNGTEDRTQWHKYDGKVYALDPELTPAWAQPYPGHLVPYCYEYDGRSDPVQCPDGGAANYYNGTVEGTAALSEDQSVLYVGRGDGKVYALDPNTGEELWVFTTFNPQDPADPMGGGQVMQGPTVGPDGTVYVTTVGTSEHETNALYALSPGGQLLWRYPSEGASADNVFLAPPALAPDGATLYLAAGWGPRMSDWDVDVPGAIHAFDATAGPATGDERLRWTYLPVNEGEWWNPTVWTTALAVGSDGTLYAAGPEWTLGGGTAVAFALRDLGDHAELVWDEYVDLDRDRAVMANALALREENGVTTRVYAGSGNVPNPLTMAYPEGGKLYALDPATGAPAWNQPFDPEQHGSGGTVQGLAIDRDGVVYTSVSGTTDGGRVFALEPDGSVIWTHDAGDLLEWSTPVLGPQGTLYFAESSRDLCFLQPIETGACDGQGGFHWHLESEADESGDWNSLIYKYEGDAHTQILPLLAHSSLTLDVRPGQAMSQDWELVIALQLSGNLSGSRNQIIYNLGPNDLSILNDDDELYLPLQATEGVWTELTLDLSAAAAYFPEGRDQAVREYYVILRTREGLRVELDIDDWTREWAVEGEALRQRHRNWLDQHFAASPVTHFVGTEMTPIHAGRHLVPVGEGIPLFPYQEVIPLDAAVNYVHARGGAAICAHPFGVQPVVLYEDAAADPVIETEVTMWRIADGYGCDAVEVGYQARVLGVVDYLRFWDELGRVGLLVTGVGVSDNHWAQDWADAANTWVTWVYLDVPDEDGIADAIQRGRVFFGDPIVFAGHDPLLDIWSEHGIVMGQADRTWMDQRIHVETGYLEPGWTLALVVDGEDFDTVTLVGDETDTVFDLPREYHRVVRAEVRDLDGNPILVSNPFYLLTPNTPITIPAHRQVN